MKLKVLRYSSQKDDTLGLLFIDGAFACYTLEDEYRKEKVWGETRIPAGRYEIAFRKVGGFHLRYLRKFSDIHIGMLEIKNVPNFKYVLIHIGNRDDDTAGCLLVGDGAMQNITDDGVVTASKNAYCRIYPIIAAALEREEKVFIEIKDIEV